MRLAFVSSSLIAGAATLQPISAAQPTGATTPIGQSITPQDRDAAKQKAEKQESTPDKSQKPEIKAEKKWTKDERRDSIRQAQIWSPTEVSQMNLRLGPEGSGSFQPGEEVTCDYVLVENLPGATPKFDCAISKDDVVKVKYGATNAEVEGGVLATRLLWALGFGADRVYPVRVRCRGCSADPWKSRQPAAQEQLFDPAAIERKVKGDEIKADKKGGWAWRELDRVDERAGGATKAQRDGLKLLAVFIQHTDSKVEQQRLVCLPGGRTEDGGCNKPFMYLHDVGLTFGHANLANDPSTGGVNFEEWAKTPIWRDAKSCVGHMSRSYSGTLGDPQISEAGRQFLADLLVQLTDAQLHDLFEAARVDHRSRKPGTEAPPASVDEWVSVFKQKRDEIVSTHCPAVTVEK